MIRHLLAIAQERFKKNKSFFLYILIGFSGLTLDMLSFTLMTRGFHLSEYIANPISMSLGIINNFFLNAFLNFKKTDRLGARFMSFYTVGLVGVAVSNGILWLFNDILGNMVSALLMWITPVLAQYRLELVKGGSIVVIAILQYFLNKRFSFQSRDTAK